MPPTEEIEGEFEAPSVFFSFVPVVQREARFELLARNSSHATSRIAVPVSRFLQGDRRIRLACLAARGWQLRCDLLQASDCSPACSGTSTVPACEANRFWMSLSDPVAAIARQLRDTLPIAADFAVSRVGSGSWYERGRRIRGVLC